MDRNEYNAAVKAIYSTVAQMKRKHVGNQEMLAKVEKWGEVAEEIIAVTYDIARMKAKIPTISDATERGHAQRKYYEETVVRLEARKAELDPTIPGLAAAIGG